MKTILTVLGARPQFIKAAMVSRAIAEHNAQVLSYPQLTDNRSQITEYIIHIGQHFDDNMSQVFFDELEIPRPDHYLGVSGGGHGVMTGAMLEKLEPLLQEITPDWVIVYGDTNSTLAGALAAAKLHIPVAHVEAGLRSYNRRMPEEINRILTDQIADLLFTPTDAAGDNLRREGFAEERIRQVGDVMYDAALFYGDRAAERSAILAEHCLTKGEYVLATVHRAENTDDPNRRLRIMDGLDAVATERPVVLPLHPRTRAALIREGLKTRNIQLIDPVGYLDMAALETNAAVIATDSGGVQKEAYFHGVPCVTLRDETEWTELVETGWNRLAPPGSADIKQEIRTAFHSQGNAVQLYGDGNAAKMIVGYLKSTNKIGNFNLE